MKQLVIVAALALAAQANAASLMGQTLQYEYFFPGLNNVYYSKVVTVGEGVELANLFSGESVASMDIDATGVTIKFLTTTYWNPSAFNGFRITDFSNSLADITALTIASNEMNGTPTTGYSNNSFWVNWQGISFTKDSQLRLSLDTAVSAVPLPGAASLMLGGLAFLAGLRRKRSARQQPSYALAS